jgi:protein TonB
MLSFACFAQEKGKRGTIKIEKTTCVLLENNDSVYAYVDQMPEFKGGSDSLNNWMNRNLRYPKTSIEESSFGTVYASFIVLKDGTISSIKIFKGNNAAFEKEALRLLDLMPDWEPGRCSTHLVDVKINFPVKFILK